MEKARRVVLGVTASIALYKACDLVRRLRAAGCSVTVVMTPEAAKLVHPLVFQSLSGSRVYHELFGEPDACEVEHVSLADMAQLVLIAPATAQIIAKVASGLCDDLLSCVVCATAAPVVFAPAMNERMWLNRITQGNKKKLAELGYHFIEPRKGELACGREGVGCLAEAEVIVAEALRLIAKEDMAA